MTNQSNSQRGLFLRRLILAAGIVTLAIVVWGLFVLNKDAKDHDNPPPDALAEGIVEEFYVGVSSLDVEANQRAAEIFKTLTQKAADEPAVWANYGVALLRLNEIDTAKEVLRQTHELAPQDAHIVWLQAVAEERAGQYDAAIDLIRSLKSPNIMALYQLAHLVERTGRDTADEERLTIVKQILEQAPENLLAQISRARIAAKLEDKDELQAALLQLGSFQQSWSETALLKYKAATDATDNGNFRNAGRELLLLENVLKPTAVYQMSSAAVRDADHAIGPPIRSFMKLAPPSVVVAPADRELRFLLEPSKSHERGSQMLWTIALSGESYSKLILNSNQILLSNKTSLPFPGDANQSSVGISSVLGVDLNADFLLDLAIVGENGLTLYVQNPTGEFTPFLPDEQLQKFFQEPLDGVWAIDIEADGDLDLLLSPLPSEKDKEDKPAGCQVLRNNGDLTFTLLNSLSDMPPLRRMHWIDFDNDGDGDVAGLDEAGHLWIAWNERSGQYASPERIAAPATVLSTAVADVNGDGVIELVAIDVNGDVHALSYPNDDKQWTSHSLAHWNELPELNQTTSRDRLNLCLADIDNNGAIDIVASAGQQTAIWLNEGADKFFSADRYAPNVCQ